VHVHGHVDVTAVTAVHVHVDVTAVTAVHVGVPGVERG
jgi:hypothetical protein